MAGRFGNDRFDLHDSAEKAEGPREVVGGGKRKEGNQPCLNRG